MVGEENPEESRKPIRLRCRLEPGQVAAVRVADDWSDGGRMQM